jgi:hypothetical protein
MNDPALGFAFLGALLGLYFAPAIVASARKHHNTLAIFVLNFFLGWTFLGWVVALVWAFTADRRAPTAGFAHRAAPLRPVPEAVHSARRHGRRSTGWPAIAAIAGVTILVLVGLISSIQPDSTTAQLGPSHPAKELRVSYADPRQDKFRGQLTCSHAPAPMPPPSQPTTLSQCRQMARAQLDAMIANIRVTAACWEEVAQRASHLPAAATVRESGRGLMKLIPSLEESAGRQLRKVSTLAGCQDHLNTARELVRLQPEFRGEWSTGIWR